MLTYVHMEPLLWKIYQIYTRNCLSYEIYVIVFVHIFKALWTASDPPTSFDIPENHLLHSKSTDFEVEDLSIDLHKSVTTMRPSTQCATIWWSSTWTSSTVVWSWHCISISKHQGFWKGSLKSARRCCIGMDSRFIATKKKKVKSGCNRHTPFV